MQYETPEVLLVGSANSLILGQKTIGPIDRVPEIDFRKGDDVPEGLDE